VHEQKFIFLHYCFFSARQKEAFLYRTKTKKISEWALNLYSPSLNPPLCISIYTERKKLAIFCARLAVARALGEQYKI
jgi:hypothetical protein